jgi:hypothetical protein
MEGYDDKKAKDIASKLSEADKLEYVKMGYETASKAVLYSLVNALRQTKPLLAERLEKLAFNRANSLAVEFSCEGSDYKLCSCLAAVDATYKTTLNIPESFDKMNTLLEYFTLLKLIATTYWESFKVQNKDIYQQIKKVFGELDLEEVVGNQTTLRFSSDKLDNYRVSIFCYFMDSEGNALRKGHKE